MSRYCVKSFLSQSTEKLRRGTLLFSYRSSGIEKIHGQDVGNEGGRSVTIFGQKCFVPEHRKTS